MKKTKKPQRNKKVKAINITKIQLLQRILLLENQVEELQSALSIKQEE